MIAAYPKFAIGAPDLRWTALAAGGSLKRSIKIPGTTGEVFVLEQIAAGCYTNAGVAVIGRFMIDFPDQKYKLTNVPVHWRTFWQSPVTGFNPLPATLSIPSGTMCDITCYNDDVVAFDAEVSLIGHIENGR